MKALNVRRTLEYLRTRRPPASPLTFAFLIFVCILNVAVIISNHRSARNSSEICRDVNGANVGLNEDSNFPISKESPPSNAVNILVFARMRTGSSLSADYFSLNPDFFYVYEPGFILNRFRRDVWDDSWMFLEGIREELTGFMDGIYNCNLNFTGKEQFLRAMNEVPWMKKLTRTEFLTTVNERGILNVCKYRQHKLIKTVRLNNIIMAAQMIRKNNVKVIQVVRDPRGMSSSRARFQIYKKYKNTPSRDEMLDKLDDIVRNYCAWMETNYVSVMHGPEWLRNNYKIVRFEDLVARPAESAAALYKFVGLPITDKVRQKIRTLEEEKPMDAEAWRFKTGMELARRAQEMCSPTVYDMFGYRMINRGGILMNKNFSLVGDLPRSSMFLLDNI